MTTVDCNAPVVNPRVRRRSLQWVTPSIEDLMKKHDYYHKKAKGVPPKGVVILKLLI